ncbi:hypothetical protein [Sediminitomix flava]|uniref:Uncharacterized protein n=1 Tax=Sediminitomix flava TaxID=379075 RepID=A0A315ZGA9_SEDFL|nr:hypothetical protein [Sediminitomix flava]PWJ43784.1 hypothetical protein BC781_101130 [Sediminitomix flava]
MLDTFFVLLFSALSSTGSSESIILSQKTKTLIRQEIEDKQTKKEVVQLLNYYKWQHKKLRKLEQKEELKFIRLLRKNHHDSDEFSALINRYFLIRQLRQELRVTYAIKVKNKISDNEWASLQIKGTDFLAKQYDINQNIKNRLLRRNKKIDEKIERVAFEPHRQHQIDAIINEINIAELNTWAAFSLLTERDQKIIFNKYSSYQDYKTIMDNANQNLHQLLINYVDGHFQLLEITSENEWQKIQRIIRFTY